MSRTDLKRTAVHLATAIVLVVALFLGYGFVASSRAEAKAVEACALMPEGSLSTQAVTIASKMDVTPRLRIISAEGVSVGFEGAFLIERWFCNVRFRDGKVVEHEVRVLD